jgi:hypothetical protein
MAYELPIDGIDSVTSPDSTVEFTPIGTAVTADEIKTRLSGNLYTQLCDGDDTNTMAAVQRAEIYAGSVFRRLLVSFNLDIHVQREFVLLMTIYELHMALGHEEAGREYRLKGKDIILAVYGDYPDTDDKTPAKSAAAAVSVPNQAPAPGMPSRYQLAFHIGDRFGRRY